MGEINASRNGTEAEAAINAEFDQRVKLLDEIGQRLGYNAEVAAGFDAALIDREAALQDLRLKQAEDLDKIKEPRRRTEHAADRARGPGADRGQRQESQRLRGVHVGRC
jgi:hypothetical protein